jgi:hypothetical protein
MTHSTHNASSLVTNNDLVGWMPEGNDRGTWKVVTTSILTITICTWTVLHPRIHVGRKLQRAHKACQLVKQVFAPELESIEALQEFLQARKMMKCCAAKTNNGLKFAQSYYIGMMGVRYRTGIKGGYRVMWPLQYAYLLNSGLVSWPPDESWGLSEELIEDKSKADGLLKLVALWQVLWFTINCITRSVHGMELAPLESMTLAYVVQVVLTYCLWWKKPKDIATASYVTLPDMDDEQRHVFESLSMEITYDVPDATKNSQSMGIAWYIIPRDCSETAYQIAKGGSPPVNGDTSAVIIEGSPTQLEKPLNGKPQGVSVETKEYLPENIRLTRAQALAMMELGERPGIKSGGSEPSDTEVVTEWDDTLYMTKWWPFVCLLGCSFGAVHLISWNAIFPTNIELWLWRASSVGSIITALITMQFKKISLRWQGAITIIQIGSPILYVVCRVIMVAETTSSFRALPRSVYQTYVIANYWFHFF